MQRLLLVLSVLFIACSVGKAAPQPPNYLPRYNVGVSLDPEQKLAEFQIEATWTNPSTQPADQLVMHFYPFFKIPKGDTLLLAKTLELLRLDPSFGIDQDGHHGELTSIRLGSELDPRTQQLNWRVRAKNQTGLEIDLPKPVAPGESITIHISGQVKLPNKQGRWGVWQGITSFVNALPIFAYFNAEGWQDVPFIPWHQPFWHESAHYQVNLTVPTNQQVAASAPVLRTKEPRAGWKTIEFQPFTGRDFAICCSEAYLQKQATANLPDGRKVLVKCLAVERHQYYAEEMCKIAAAALEQYSQWFSPYQYDELTIAESYFGWNGNECSGLIMIDERVFDMPKVANGYVEYLVSHETCHQWWYNLVGTNGYSETFIDEGAATYFTHRFLDKKRGKNNPFILWPDSRGRVLPNIGRENYRNSGIYGAIGRGDAPQAAGELTEFGHLANLFSAAYDRGSKVFSQMESRMGEQAFMEFIRGLIGKYSYRILSAKDLKQELVAYSGPSSASHWDDYFEKWVYGKGLTDWGIESVNFNKDGPRVQQLSGPLENAKGSVRATVIVKQHCQIDEPTEVGFQFEEGDGYPVRVPISIGNGLHPTTLPADSEVEPLGGGKYRVTVTLPSKPKQIIVDPDRMLLDADPSNNRWDRWPRVRVVPVYSSMVYETDLTNDYDRWNINIGTWIYGQTYQDPWYTRTSLIGARIGAYRTQQFNGGVYAAYRPDYQDMVLGVDGLVDHWPLPRTQVGFNYERRIAGPWGGMNGEQTANRANIFGRYIIQYGSSMYLPPMSYIEAFSTYQDNFLPIARETNAGAVRPDATWLNGMHFRLNLYTPYWDAERGFWVDLTAAGGVTDLASKRTGTGQFRGEFAVTRKLPEGLGYFSKVKLASRLVVQGAVPDEGQFFALGGGTLFRGFDLAERQGSILWTANTEVRFPLLSDARLNFADSLFGVRNVYLAGFYDVGNVYANGRSVGGAAHALGTGLRVDSSVFSFLERVTFRADVAKTINAASPFQFWFGIQHPF
jgi:hypothetical protein